MLTLILARFAPNAAPDLRRLGGAGLERADRGLQGRGGRFALGCRAHGAVALRDRALAEALPAPISLPRAVRSSPLAVDIAAEISAEHDEIGRLATLLRAGAWGDWPANAQVLALASRVQLLHYGEEHGRMTWADALAACGDSYVGQRALARLAAEWHYYEGEELVLRHILARDPKKSFLRGPAFFLPARGDFAQLWDLYGAWSRQLPDDPSIAAAWIMLGSILDHTDRATLERAAALQARFPDSLPAGVAHAAALWRMGRAGPRPGKILAALPPAGPGKGRTFSFGSH